MYSISKKMQRKQLPSELFTWRRTCGVAPYRTATRRSASSRLWPYIPGIRRLHRHSKGNAIAHSHGRDRPAEQERGGADSHAEMHEQAESVSRSLDLQGRRSAGFAVQRKSVGASAPRAEDGTDAEAAADSDRDFSSACARVVEDRVYALTPKGSDRSAAGRDAPRFAYSVHTSLGHVVGAKVNAASAARSRALQR